MPEISLELTPADPRNFTGTAFMRMLAAAQEDEAIKLYYVRFEPGARTNWHTHSGDQVLVVTEGRCRVQIEGEPPRDFPAGQSIRIPAGIRHWHGATPSDRAEHIAINLNAQQTNWLEPVTEQDFTG